jgi:hypothetical protein
MSYSFFPVFEGIDIGVERTQEYDTKIQRESGGRNLTIGRRSQAVYRWRLTYNLIRDYAATDEFLTLTHLHAVLVGRKDPLLFRDPISPTATLWPFRDGIGTGTIRSTGNGTSTVMYCCDTNGDPLPYSHAPFVFVNGVQLVYGAGAGKYISDGTTGCLRVTFGTAPGSGDPIAWSAGTDPADPLGITTAYYRLVRFAGDGLTLTRRFSGLYTAKVELVSQVLP